MGNGGGDPFVKYGVRELTGGHKSKVARHSV